MPTIEVHRPDEVNINRQKNPLPELLQTPAGLAIIEIQGTIHAPTTDAASESEALEVGRLEFPLYDGTSSPVKSDSWMKKVHLYIGKHQRLNGEVKKLPKPIAVLSKRPGDITYSDTSETADGGQSMQELDILAVVKYKIIFSSRPEPVGVKK